MQIQFSWTGNCSGFYISVVGTGYWKQDESPSCGEQTAKACPKPFGGPISCGPCFALRVKGKRKVICRVAVSRRAALKVFWGSGGQTPALLVCLPISWPSYWGWLINRVWPSIIIQLYILKHLDIKLVHLSNILIIENRLKKHPKTSFLLC